jgi:hypothetical protein
MVDVEDVDKRASPTTSGSGLSNGLSPVSYCLTPFWLIEGAHVAPEREFGWVGLVWFGLVWFGLVWFGWLVGLVGCLPLC